MLYGSSLTALSPPWAYSRDLVMSVLYVYVVFRLCRCEKTSWWALTEDSLPNIFGESAKGLFRLVGDSTCNSVSVRVYARV